MALKYEIFLKTTATSTTVSLEEFTQHFGCKPDDGSRIGDLVKGGKIIMKKMVG